MFHNCCNSHGLSHPVYKIKYEEIYWLPKVSQDPNILYPEMKLADCASSDRGVVFRGKNPPLLHFPPFSCWVEGRKEMFYLTTHSTHFIYGYMASDMVNDHSDSEKGKPLPPPSLLFPIKQQGFFLYAPSHRQDSTNHGICYTSRGALAGTRNSSMGPPHEGSIRRSIAP